MRFHDINDIIRSAREQLVCPKCGRHYAEHALDAVDIQGTKGVLAGQCTHCGTSTMMVMNVREFTQRIETRDKQVRKVQTSGISPNDVIDMKQLLDGFDGDFKDKFEKKKQVQEKNTSTTKEQTPPPPSPAAGA